MSCFIKISKFFITYNLIYSHCIEVNYNCTLPKNVGCLEICDVYIHACNFGVSAPSKLHRVESLPLRSDNRNNYEGKFKKPLFLFYRQEKDGIIVLCETLLREKMAQRGQLRGDFEFPLQNNF